MTTLYGIKNCDTVKKARSWLDTHKVDYQFHDFRSDGLSETKVKTWLKTLGLETLVNKRSTTWKELDDATKAAFSDSTAVPIIVANPTLIKRPVLETTSETRVGFNAADYQTLFS
jgi:Spx/MgsR family transcriptional regulator